MCLCQNPKGNCGRLISGASWAINECPSSLALQSALLCCVHMRVRQRRPIALPWERLNKASASSLSSQASMRGDQTRRGRIAWWKDVAFVHPRDMSERERPGQGTEQASERQLWFMVAVAASSRKSDNSRDSRPTGGQRKLSSGTPLSHQ